MSNISDKKRKAFQKFPCESLDNQPRFYKAGYNYLLRLKSVKEQKFSLRMILALTFKQRGNQFFKIGLKGFITQLQMNTNRVFVSSHILRKAMNSSLLLITEEKMTKKNLSCDFKELKGKLYMNLALCYIKMNFLTDAVYACDHALEFDKGQIKIYFRRAKVDSINNINKQARTLQPNLESKDYQYALEDLQKAHKLDPNDPDVKRELAKLQLKLKKEEVQILNSQPKSPVRSSSTSSDSSQDEPQAQATTNHEDFWKQFNIHKDYENFDYELSYEEDPTQPVPPEVHELGRFIELRGVEMLRVFENQGKQREADQLKEKLRKAIAAKKQLEKISKLDFSKPKRHLQEIAMKFGIDLLEDSIQNEFKRIQMQNILDIRKWLHSNKWTYQLEIVQQQAHAIASVPVLMQQRPPQQEQQEEPQARAENVTENFDQLQGGQGEQREDLVQVEEIAMEEELTGNIPTAASECNLPTVRNVFVFLKSQELGMQGVMLDEEILLKIMRSWQELKDHQKKSEIFWNALKTTIILFSFLVSVATNL